MACPFSAYYASKNNAERVTGSGQTEVSSSNLDNQPERKTSVSRVAEFQHQGSFSQKDDPQNRFTRGETPTRIVWERGPSLEQLKGTNGVGMVQQRVNIFSQQISKETTSQLTASGINRSISSSAVSSRFTEEDPAPRRPRTPRMNESQPLLKEPKKPLDKSEPLSLRNIAEAVWTFVTVPVSNLSLS